MSDQPKPTFTEERRQKAERDPIGDYGVCQPEPTGERTTGEWTCGGDDIQPKPTTGEWTAESVGKFNGARWIADAHNAALAAEQKSSGIIAENARNLHIENVTLAKQLAAESEKVESAERNCDSLASEKHRKSMEIDKLRQQLAAERKNAKNWCELHTLLAKDTQQLREQLDDERERIKVLEDGTALNAVIATNQQLREQLAAERELLEQGITAGADWDWHNRVKAALAKVKEDRK